MTQNGNLLTQLSDGFVAAVELAAPSIVRVDDRSRLTATGTVWAPDLVVATSHGVEQDEALVIVTHDGTELAAEVVGRDPEWDVALLRVKDGNLRPIVRETEPKVGTFSLALGRPGRSGLNATLGVIGSISKGPGEGQYLHTDAVLYPGFSGGALVNGNGAFLGLLNVGWGRGRGVALDEKLVESSIDLILTGQTTGRAFLGVAVQGVRLTGKGKHDYGLLISSIEADSAAEAAGVLIGDVLLSVGDSALRAPEDLRRALRRYRRSESTELRIWRAGSVITVPVTLGGASE